MHGFDVSPEIAKQMIKACVDYKREINRLASLEAKKGNNMNEQVQKQETVKVTPQTEEFLAKVAKQLDEKGEVIVQTDADVGTETIKQTVH